MANEPKPAPDAAAAGARPPESSPRSRYVTRGGIRHDKRLIPAGTPIRANDLPEGDFARLIKEGTIVVETR